MTLAVLAEKAGVAVSTISKIENGLVSASFDTLLQLCHGLGVSFEELLGHSVAVANTQKRAITHSGSAVTFATPQYGYEVHAQELSSKRMIPLVMEIKNQVFDEAIVWSQHPGEEFIYIISGELDLYCGPYASTRLKAGDSAYIDSGMSHAFVSRGAMPARMLSVCLDIGTSDRPTETFINDRVGN